MIVTDVNYKVENQTKPICPLSFEKLALVAQRAFSNIKHVFSTILAWMFPKYFGGSSVTVDQNKLPFNKEQRKAALEAMQQRSRTHFEELCDGNIANSKIMWNLTYPLLEFKSPIRGVNLPGQGIDVLGDNIAKGYVKMNGKMSEFIISEVFECRVAKLAQNLNNAIDANEFGNKPQLEFIAKLKSLNSIKLDELTYSQQQRWADEFAALEIPAATTL